MHVTLDRRDDFFIVIIQVTANVCDITFLTTGNNDAGVESSGPGGCIAGVALVQNQCCYAVVFHVYAHRTDCGHLLVG